LEKEKDGKDKQSRPKKHVSWFLLDDDSTKQQTNFKIKTVDAAWFQMHIREQRRGGFYDSIHGRFLTAFAM